MNGDVIAVFNSFGSFSAAQRPINTKVTLEPRLTVAWRHVACDPAKKPAPEYTAKTTKQHF